MGLAAWKWTVWLQDFIAGHGPNCAKQPSFANFSCIYNTKRCAPDCQAASVRDNQPDAGRPNGTKYPQPLQQNEPSRQYDQTARRVIFANFNPNAGARGRLDAPTNNP